MGIQRFLPNNEYQAAVNANSPSASNPFATQNDTYTDEQVDDRVAALIQDGTGISWTYNDVGNTLTGNIGGLTVSEFTSPNVSQWTNDAGYLTAETDTLSSVLARGETSSGNNVVLNYGDVIRSENATPSERMSISFGSPGFGGTDDYIWIARGDGGTKGTTGASIYGDSTKVEIGYADSSHYFKINSSGFILSAGGSGKQFDIPSSIDLRLGDSGFWGHLNPTTLTANRVYTFQDSSGTVAFVSDIPAPDGNGMYDGSGTIPPLTIATLTDSLLINSGNVDFIFDSANGLGVNKLTAAFPLDVAGAGNFTGDIYTSASIHVGGTSPSAKVHVLGAGATSATTSLLIENSGATELIKILDDGTISMPGKVVQGVDSQSASTSLSVDLSEGQHYDITVDAGGAFDYTNPPSSSERSTYLFVFTQDAGGGNTVTFTAGKFAWSSNNVPVIGEGANEITVLWGYWNGSRIVLSMLDQITNN